MAFLTAGILLSGGFCLREIRPYIVLSGSMEPAISTGSLIFIQSGKKTPEVGDIIAFQLGDTTVTHRVTERKNEGYVTKGDANEKEDTGIVSPDRVLGICRGSVPWLGYGVNWLRKPSVRTILAGLLAMKLIVQLVKKEKEIVNGKK